MIRYMKFAIPNPTWISWNKTFRKCYQFGFVASSFLNIPTCLLHRGPKIKPSRFRLCHCDTNSFRSHFDYVTVTRGVVYSVGIIIQKKCYPKSKFSSYTLYKRLRLESLEKQNAQKAKIHHSFRVQLISTIVTRAKRVRESRSHG